MIVTIAGRPGSGKSAVAVRLADRLGLRHVSAGDFMREMAAERGVSILELSHSAESGDEIDREIDARTVRFAETSDDFVMDARLGWHFIPRSVKVFLDVRPDVAARRIFGAGRAAEHENTDLVATMAAIEERTASEIARYRSYYGIDYLDPAHYDVVVDTSALDVEGVVDEIVTHLGAADLP